LPDIAKETLDGIGALNMPMHALRKGIKGQQMLFVLCQAANRFGIAFAIFGFEGRQLHESLLFRRLLPNCHQFRLNLSTLSPGNSIEDVVYGLRTS
jgi:hypothetical protein